MKKFIIAYENDNTKAFELLAQDTTIPSNRILFRGKIGDKIPDSLVPKVAAHDAELLKQTSDGAEARDVASAIERGHKTDADMALDIATWQRMLTSPQTYINETLTTQAMVTAEATKKLNECDTLLKKRIEL